MNNTPAIQTNHAIVNVTYAGQNGDLADPVPFDLSDADIRRMATEALASGAVVGVPTQTNPDLRDFVVDRFEANEAVPFRRVMLRPKTPFGG